MKKNALSAFTLIEMLTVMAIIAVLASLVVAISSVVNSKAAKARAEGEIVAMSAACETYKGDNGVYPRNADTDSLDPREDANPTKNKYQDASLFLYSELSGDALPDKAPDGKPEADTKVYYSFRSEVLAADKDSKTGKIKKVKYIQDPFGQSYGYSTAAAEEEQDFLKDLRKDPSAKRDKNTKGYNSATFDLWSTGGQTSVTASSTSKGEVDQTRWIKNW
jgi:prepilin-type N-terminal cleavage/methylation domain-containing protein